MTEKCRYCYVLDNGKPTFYDLNKKDILQMYQVEDLLNEQDIEIQQLKMTMKGVAELLSIEADLFSDKATEHDINAYIELQEFDNKDAFYMAVSIKKSIKMLRGDIDD